MAHLTTKVVQDGSAGLGGIRGLEHEKLGGLQGLLIAIIFSFSSK